MSNMFGNQPPVDVNLGRFFAFIAICVAAGILLGGGIVYGLMH